MKNGNPGNSGKKPLFTTWPRDQTALIPWGWVAFFLLREKKGNPPPRDQSSLIPRPRGEKGYFLLSKTRIRSPSCVFIIKTHESRENNEFCIRVFEKEKIRARESFNPSKL